MKKTMMLLTIGSMVFTSAFLTAQEPAKEAASATKKDAGFNQTATNLFISQVKSGTLTPEKLKKLKEKKADINAKYKKDDGTETNLFLESVCFPNANAVRECADGSFNFSKEYLNQFNILIALVEAGADTNVTDSNGRNALILAILNIGEEKFRDAIVKYLRVNAHVEVEKADSNGGTPLMYAIKFIAIYI